MFAPLNVSTKISIPVMNSEMIYNFSSIITVLQFVRENRQYPMRDYMDSGGEK